MQFTVNDYIGFTGVFILLIAYLLNLAGKISRTGFSYALLNVVGGGLACLASVLIHYVPFIILEGTWAMVSLIAAIKYFAVPAGKQ
jgi:hypothetical protein